MTDPTDPWADAHRDQMAQEVAEYIARKPAYCTAGGEVRVVFQPLDQRPSTAVEEIKADLLAGRVWISWLDPQVLAALGALGFVAADQ